MPTISTFYGIVIQMFCSDHNPPHFHASYGGEEVLLDIQTCEVLEGSIPHRAFSLVLEWAEAYRAELLEDWRLCQRKERPRKIDPLR